MSFLNQKTKKQKQQQQQNNDIDIGDKIIIPEQPLLLPLVEETNIIDVVKYLDQQYQSDKGQIEHFPMEQYYGPTEYKLKIDPTQKRLQNLSNQMRFRLEQGKDVAYYKVGVHDSGKSLGLEYHDMLRSIRVLHLMATQNKADLIIQSIKPGVQGKIAEIKVRKLNEGVLLDIRILMVGQSASGKTSLLGVISSGQADDGKGQARMKFLKNQTQMLTGKTEHPTHTVIGFDSVGNIVNHQAVENYGNQASEEQFLIDLSSKLITFIDMGGTKRAHIQMIQIFNAQFPDYALVIVSAISELNKFTFEQLKLIQMKQIPFFIVITHIDQLKQVDQWMDIVDQFKSMFKTLQIEGIPIVVRKQSDVLLFTKEILKKSVIPIFNVSNTQYNTLDNFIQFLKLLPSSNTLINNFDQNTEYCIHQIYDKENIIILGGTVTKGSIKVGQILQIGPDKMGRFFPIQVEEIQCSRVKAKSAKCGQMCSLRFKTNYSTFIGTDNNPIRKGMVLVEAKSNPKAAIDFSAEIFLYYDQDIQIPTTIEPVINTQYSRQICKIIKEDFIIDLQKIDLFRRDSKSTDQKQQQISNQMPRKQMNRTNSSQNLKNPQLKQQQQQQEQQQQQQKQRRSNQRLEQPVELIDLKCKQSNLMRFKFRYVPEYLTEGMKILINEPTLQAWGVIKTINY